MDMCRRERLNVTTKPRRIKIISEPYLVASRMGYAPMVDVEAMGGIENTLLISSASITSALEALRVANGGRLMGICLEVSRESEDSKAKYVAKSTI